jgi:hypothetical protein
VISGRWLLQRDASGAWVHTTLPGVLHRLLWRPFYLSALLLFVYTVAQLAQPILLELLLDYLDTMDAKGQAGPPKWHG